MRQKVSLAILVLAICTASSSFGQQTALFLFETPDGKSGYIDASGRVVIPAQFDAGGEFHEGRAWVYKGEKRGLIDESGKLLIDLRHDSAGGFSEGLAWFGTRTGSSREKRGYADRSGNVVIPPQYDQAGSFKEGLAVVTVGTAVRYIDATGHVVIDRGEQLLPFETIRELDGGARGFSEGLAAFSAPSDVFGCRGWPGEHDPALVIDAKLASSPEGRRLEKECHKQFGSWEALTKWGYVDKSGKTVIAPQFDLAGRFSEGLARVKLDGRELYIDHTGATVLRTDADHDAGGNWTVLSFSQGLAGIRMGGKWGFIDKKGNLVIKPEFDGVGPFSDDRAWVVAGKSIGYIDPAGKTVVPPRYISLSGPMFGGEIAGENFSNGLAVVRSAHGCWGYIDAAGKYVWQFAGRKGEWPCVEPATPQTPEAIVARARELVTKGEAAEVAGDPTVVSSDAIEASTNALAGYLKTHPDEVGTILLAARLARLREIFSPVVAEGANLKEDLKKAAAAMHQRVDAMESLLDHALTIEPHNAETYYWKGRLYGIRTPAVVGDVVKMNVSDFDRAVASTKKAIELAPDSVPYKEALATFYIEADRFADAAATLAPVAGGRHPVYVLLEDLEQIPLPQGAVFDPQDTENFAMIKEEKGEIRDYVKLRTRSWIVPGPASGIEEFYRTKWPGFVLYKGPNQSQEGVTITAYEEHLRWDGARPVPLTGLRARMSSVEGKLSMGVLEFRLDSADAQKVVPSSALLPEDRRKVFCVVAIYNRRALSQ